MHGTQRAPDGDDVDDGNVGDVGDVGEGDAGAARWCGSMSVSGLWSGLSAMVLALVSVMAGYILPYITVDMPTQFPCRGQKNDGLRARKRRHRGVTGRVSRVRYSAPKHMA
ncbi:hypothetical protein [Cupriavidus sp. WS]|uniref:hypothetical protein n=1 Tax=Cupriavidus sp. WS TaxID=1312922 RepID=UPI0012DFA0D7|nr:hypothetical protein [Cupriavidus sp. WS]